ncbi:unnamed protein product [Trichogramma brassicae]|uniref:Uncharacterized protein n=1 Tax=Trichogramma brassicae TaxID=86971 RepID=A0A6H5J5K8_9HYME|nr:unnamed protein product [Trichogramma brassicae]
MNLYDDRCATFGITEKVRGLPVTAGDAYELVRRSVCDFRHYGKSARTARVDGEEEVGGGGGGGGGGGTLEAAARRYMRHSTRARAHRSGRFIVQRLVGLRVIRDVGGLGRWHAVCVMPGVAVVHFSPSRTSRPVGRRPTARSVDRGAALTSSRATDRWCFPARLPDDGNQSVPGSYQVQALIAGVSSSDSGGSNFHDGNNIIPKTNVDMEIENINLKVFDKSQRRDSTSSATSAISNSSASNNKRKRTESSDDNGAQHVEDCETMLDILAILDDVMKVCRLREMKKAFAEKLDQLPDQITVLKKLTLKLGCENAALRGKIQGMRTSEPLYSRLSRAITQIYLK